MVYPTYYINPKIIQNIYFKRNNGITEGFKQIFAWHYNLCTSLSQFDVLEAEVVDAGVQHSVRADGGVAAGVPRPPPGHEGGQGLGAEDLQSTEQCISIIYYCTAL